MQFFLKPKLTNDGPGESQEGDAFSNQQEVSYSRNKFD